MSLNVGERCKITTGELHKFWSESEELVIFQGILEPASKDFENRISIIFGLTISAVIGGAICFL